ncbi:MAG: hypothetical protein Q4A54_04150, partial [Parabacteroides sp.]|nr:hypothetical protein [Parabacteroides sp.]
MNRIYTYPLLAILFVWLTSCEDIQDVISNENSTKKELEILNVSFDESYKNFYIDIKLHEGITYSLLEDFNQIQIKVKEYDHEMKELVEEAQPHLIGVDNIKSKMVDDLGMKALVLVDLTLDEMLVEKQKVSLGKLKSLFNKDNLYVAFMKNNEVSASYPVTHYLIENYFQSSQQSKLLYRSISAKIDE